VLLLHVNDLLPGLRMMSPDELDQLLKALQPINCRVKHTLLF
jgi:hypothetical protein